jgi:hypothetical protein
MRGASDECHHVGLRDVVLNGFAFLEVAARGNEHARVVGQMSHEFALANRVGPEAARTVVVWQRWGRSCSTWAEMEFLVGPRVEVMGVRLGC